MESISIGFYIGFFVGWLLCAITPIGVETIKFLALVLRDARRRREIIKRAEKLANGQFLNRQADIKNTLKPDN